MSKHSPGPWKWKNQVDDEEEPVLLAATGLRVCDFGWSTQYYPSEGKRPDEADAALIAAAPEMLELLREAGQWYCGELADGTDRRTAIAALLARIDT